MFYEERNADNPYFYIYGEAEFFEDFDYTVKVTLLSAVPEPATWAMMITGFGLAGSAIRRRRRNERHAAA